jgi:hypothetical protein
MVERRYLAAVKESRTIYDHICIAGNISQMLVILIAPFLGKPIPFLQLLWLNRVIAAPNGKR